MPDVLLSPLAADFTLFGGADAVLLIHGFTGSPAHMRPLGEELCRAGFTVRGLQLKGHGTCIEDMKKASAQEWLADVKEAYDALREAFRSVSVVGLSMGGVLSLILAEEREPACCVTLSAPMGVTNPFHRLAPLIGRFMPVLSKKPGKSKELVDQAYDIGYEQIPTLRVVDLDFLIRQAKEHLAQVKCPVLCVQSDEDHDIIPKSDEIILSHVSSARKERLRLKKSPHVITIGPEEDVLFPAVSTFLQSCAARQEDV